MAKDIETAYAAIDQDVIDDLVLANYRVPSEQKVGSALLLSYILMKRSAIRREKSKR